MLLMMWLRRRMVQMSMRMMTQVGGSGWWHALIAARGSKSVRGVGIARCSRSIIRRVSCRHIRDTRWQGMRGYHGLLCLCLGWWWWLWRKRGSIGRRRWWWCLLGSHGSTLVRLLLLLLWCMLLLLLLMSHGRFSGRNGIDLGSHGCYVATANADPFRIAIFVPQQVFSRGRIVFVHHTRIPTFIDWPKDAHFFTNHTGIAISWFVTGGG
mmetsp:Transcript_437/g.1054  ORF Transcript_437/g.1054 Transcript_437/m.1054 type:complete len:210 (+) Transcript_437:378-1007(+)